MFTTRVRTLVVCSMVAAVSACGHSPTSPDTAPPSAVVQVGQTSTIPGTELQVTLRGVATAASIDCVANVKCNLTPVAFLELKVPASPIASVGVRLPNAEGGDRADYGGYVVRVPKLQSIAGSGGDYVVTITAARE
jgi:hypothetical protein